MTEIGAEMPEVVSTMPTTTTELNNSSDSTALNESSTNCVQANKCIAEKTNLDSKLLDTDAADKYASPAVDSSTNNDGGNTEYPTAKLKAAPDNSTGVNNSEPHAAVDHSSTADIITKGGSNDVAMSLVAEAAITTTPQTASSNEQTTQKVEENGADAVGSSTDGAQQQAGIAALSKADAMLLTGLRESTAVHEHRRSELVDSSTKCERAQESSKAAAVASAVPAEPQAASAQKENGISEKHSDGGIVDLGDDTDDDMVATSNPKASTASQPEQSKASNEHNAEKHSNESSISSTTSSTNTTAKPPNATPANVSTNSISHNVSTALSDSDGAVVIGSDSESEEFAARKPNKENNNLTLPPPLALGAQQQKSVALAAAPVAMPMSVPVSRPAPIVDDDDDDDCVVIEDTTPSSNSDLNKRKNQSTEEHTGEDLQPPVKRLRSSIPATNDLSNLSMDSRISIPDDLNIKKINEGIYPVTLSPSTNATQVAPKLVPMAPMAPNMNVLGNVNPVMPPIPPLGTNSTLLPGLTDDMFVLEAPSFIVPYIYEKPPGLNLNEVIKDIESKYSLSKEDLAEADKTDEFDMITEQNKTDKLESDMKKKKKRRGGEEADESWSEQSEEEEDDDDDDDSETGIKTKVLIKEASDDLTVLQGAIKPAAAVAQSTTAAPNGATKPGQENYFESPLGKFFMDIGVGLVQEFVQSDLIRLQKRKMRKSLGKNTMEFERAIAALSGNLEASKKKNAAFKFTMKRCEFCNFKSESALAMANHYETPHMNGPLYKCNFCIFEIRNATEIVYHMEAVHNIKARLIKPLPYHQCPNCGFEDNGKAKLARHQPVCAKKFRPELNLAPTNDWEAPAKIPRIKPRHGLVGTATAYQAMAAQAAAQKAALASIQQQQQVQQQQRTLQAAALAAQTAANKMRGRAPIVPKPGPNQPGMLRPQHQAIRTPMTSNVVLQNNYQMPGNQLLQNAANAMAKKANAGGQPSISITPLPRQAAAPTPTAASTSKVIPAGVKPGQSPGGNKAQFVICEICDGYIKDLEQLRNHMQWMHKVKIHPKMIYNRPPLNCQKCQFRFFTDQGLERHLLGSHGLVTSSMQEAANKGKDSGRCPVCGRMYQWKLLNHVSRDHHMTLKPAHLSYKCTVCTATFGMYKQFETHVYTAHSTVAKRAMDGKKTSVPGPSGSAGSSSSSQRLTTNDSILKPLKINDEITIIPQPATKPRITNVESHVID